MKQGEGDKPYRQFLVVKPHLSDDQCHPEEHLFAKVTNEVWQEHMAADGSIEDVFQLRKVCGLSLYIHCDDCDHFNCLEK